ncbi:hypothetical protein DL93DRAFT_498645 [Clavulina sp. PMI_390]|nr:hypothetical protein DL93DRAFT_498645 [Clavulina sp. PMI_390]
MSTAYDRRYILLLITNVISRALVSFLAALLNAHLFESAFLGAILNLILASHLAITAYILHAVMQSFGLEIPIGREYPPLVEANTILSFGLEYTLCALFLWAYFRQQNQGRSENLAARHVFPAYLIMVLWSSRFAVGTWCNLPFLRALFGIPLGAVCNFALVALVYAQPSLLKLSPHHMSKQVVARAQITTSQDITIDSCHDGPLEIELMERLEVWSTSLLI